MASPTPNKGYTYPAHGGAVNAWDSPLNDNFDQIDLNVGGTYNINCGSSIAGANYNSSYATLSSTVTTTTLPTSIAQNMFYFVTGALTADLTVQFPGVGGLYVIHNGTTGSKNVLAQSVTAGSTSVTIGLGNKAFVTNTSNPYLCSEFDTGTRVCGFQQTTAPTGWTKETNAAVYDDSAIRIVTGTAGTHGTTGMSGIFGSGKNTGNHTLTVDEIPVNIVTQTVGSGTVVDAVWRGTAVANSHRHSLSLDLYYVDVIIATKA